MKKLLFLLFVVVLAGCNNNSFERYVEWCEESVVIEQQQYLVIYTNKDYVMRDYDWDFIKSLSEADIYFLHWNTSYIAADLYSIDELNAMLEYDGYLRIRKMLPSKKVVKKIKQRGKPTMEGYLKWKETQ
jgi:hypothetical protein